MSLLFSILGFSFWLLVFLTRSITRFEKDNPGGVKVFVCGTAILIAPLFLLAYIQEADLPLMTMTILSFVVLLYYVPLFLFSRGLRFRPGRFRKKYITGPLKLMYLSVKVRPYIGKARRIADDATPPVYEIDAMANEIMRIKNIDSIYAYREAKSVWRENLYYQTIEEYGVSRSDVEAFERLSADLADYPLLWNDKRDRAIKHEIAKEIVGQLKPMPSELREVKRYYEITHEAMEKDPDLLINLWRTWKSYDMIDSPGVQEEFEKRLKEDEKV